MDNTVQGLTGRRKRAGFTMMEMLIAVGILVILMAVGFIAVINYQRSMKQLELDGTAKEIFIAAQNHLSMAQSQGILNDVDADDADKVGVKGGDADDKNTVIRYWYVTPDDSKLVTPNKSLLYEMLPWASLDDTVRLGGSYVIEYDISTATVLNVFYGDKTNLSLGTERVFISGDYGTLFPNMVGQDKGDARRNDFDGGKIIGWYGGEDLDKRNAAELAAPTLKLINAERLVVKATFTSSQYTTNTKVSNSMLKIIMRGDTSKKSKEVTQEPISISGIAARDGSYTVSFVLDDITTSGKHVADLWCGPSLYGASSENGPLVPGENISVYAEVYSNSELVKIARSSTQHTNSLFADMMDKKSADGSSTTRVATVTNIRHLENIDASISGYDLNHLDADGTQQFEQQADLRWAASGSKKPLAFTSAIAGEGQTKDAAGVHEYGTASVVKVYRLDGTATKEGTFAPVTPQKTQNVGNGFDGFALTYNGNKKKISNVKVELEGTGGDAGIFATLANESSVKDLELVDCAVKTANGNAGALLGKATGKIELKNVLAHDSDGNVKSKIEGTEGVGGLVGQIAGTSGNNAIIDGCGSALLVEAKGSRSAAGGLVGAAVGNTSITNSYAGGHTKGGMYDTESYNVTSAGAAGGLVGMTAGTDNTINKCYATTSVSGGGVDGGLVGPVVGTSITDCYATGLVGGAGTQRGAFVGSNGYTSLSNNYYYEIINGDLKPVGNNDNATIEGISALDATVDTFNAFYGATLRAPLTIDGESVPVDKPYPYDSELTKRYGNLYPLRTIRMLNQDADNNWTKEHYWSTSHYGDWPSPETLVINTKQ